MSDTKQAEKYALQSTKRNGPRFDILSYNATTEMAVLLGGCGVKFEESLNKERLLKYGYKVVRVKQGESKDAIDTGVQT
jgi:hypothetical protein